MALRQAFRGVALMRRPFGLVAPLESACRAGNVEAGPQQGSEYTLGSALQPSPAGTAACPHLSYGPHRFMSGYTSATIPSISDEHVRQALNALLASNWQKLSHDVRKEVESALATGGPGKEVLEDAWRAADAVWKFSDRLEQMRMDLDDSSTDGNATQNAFATALESVKSRYDKYLASFSLEENWLKKKVETELGTPIMQLKQRVSGLGPEWSKISLLSTTGIWGSYIERRSEAGEA